tara:strand:+ start:1166 stop:1462 length:297 start_codon:yes stop_codon:yes gene_type:complete
MSIEIIQQREPVDDYQRADGTWAIKWTTRIGRCYCNREIELSRWTNSCDCGREYNSAGQQLAAREQWGCETGEHPADVARAGLTRADIMGDEYSAWGD